jgi:hypothetical protein
MPSILNATTSSGLVTSADNSGSLQLATNNGTTAVTIDTSQRVGIGTSSPSNTLQVNGTLGVLDDNLQLRRTGQTTWNITNSASNLFFNNGTDRVVIDSSGNLLVGTTTTFGGVGGITSASNFVVGSSSQYWKVTNFSSTYYFSFNGNDRATINGSTGAYTALSDANKKKDFEPSTLGLNAVMALKPTLFRMIDDEESSDKQLGFLAQDVQPVIPQAYTEQEAPDGKFIGLQDRPIIAVLTKAIQELNAKVEAQAARIAELEGAK